MRTGFVESDHEETNSVRSTPVLLGVDLRLLINPSESSPRNRMHRVRTIGDRGNKAISRNRTVVDHSFRHGLLSHEIAKKILGRVNE